LALRDGLGDRVGTPLLVRARWLPCLPPMDQYGRDRAGIDSGRQIGLGTRIDTWALALTVANQLPLVAKAPMLDSLSTSVPSASPFEAASGRSGKTSMSPRTPPPRHNRAHARASPDRAQPRSTERLNRQNHGGLERAEAREALHDVSSVEEARERAHAGNASGTSSDGARP